MVVGAVIFIIIVIIQFVVITKGAGRIAEVAARFTLDAMPGKQMAIDADLNAGLINEEQARTRRSTIAREADFYGAMDGASKFVRGDAIAGIIITIVNIIGGFIIGMAQLGMDLTTALTTYTTLTIGDGLVSQIPALMISTGAGILVSRAHHSLILARDTSALLRPRVLGVAGIDDLLCPDSRLSQASIYLSGVSTLATYLGTLRQRRKKAMEAQPLFPNQEERVEDYLHVDQWNLRSDTV